MNLEDFRPSRAYIVIEGDIYYFVPFSLSKMVELASVYGHIDDLNKVVNKQLSTKETALRLAYFMLEDKERFPIFKSFTDAIPECGVNTVVDALVKTIFDSQPLKIIDDIADNKQNAKEEPSTKKQETDWAQLYINYCQIIGGTTIDQFYSLTLRQIDAVLSRSIRPQTQKTTQQSQFSESDDQAFSDAAIKDLQKWQRSHKKNF